MKEILLISRTGMVLTNATEDVNKWNDELIAETLKQEVDANYKVKNDSILDNAKSAAKDYQMLTIMDGINDLVALFPEHIILIKLFILLKI